MGLGGGSPKLFEGYGNLDAIGRLACVEVDVGGFGGRRHVGGDLLGQLIDMAQHIYPKRCKSEKTSRGSMYDDFVLLHRNVVDFLRSMTPTCVPTMRLKSPDDLIVL